GVAGVVRSAADFGSIAQERLSAAGVVALQQKQAERQRRDRGRRIVTAERLAADVECYAVARERLRRVCTTFSECCEVVDHGGDRGIALAVHLTPNLERPLEERLGVVQLAPVHEQQSKIVHADGY